MYRLAEMFPKTLIAGFEIRGQVSSYVRQRILALRKQHATMPRNAGLASGPFYRPGVTLECQQSLGHEAVGDGAGEPTPEGSTEPISDVGVERRQELQAHSMPHGRMDGAVPSDSAVDSPSKAEASSQVASHCRQSTMRTLPMS